MRFEIQKLAAKLDLTSRISNLTSLSSRAVVFGVESLLQQPEIAFR